MELKNKTLLIAVASTVGLGILFGFIYLMSALSFRSNCIAAEAGIAAQWKGNQSSYDAFWKTVKEMAQVPEMYVSDLEKVYRGAIEGRYGEGGSKAVISLIQEHNPNFDGSLYTKIQTAIEAGRNRFNADQNQLLDKKRQYEALLGSTQALMANFWFDFPRIDLGAFNIVTSEQTEKAFVTGKAEELKLRP